MTLVDAGKDCYVNIDLITKVSYNNGVYKASFAGGTSEAISESAYKTILIYGKAKI